MKTIYRLLEIGETCRADDEYYSQPSLEWRPIGASGRIVDSCSCMVRRLEVYPEPTPIIRDARTDPPKESDAVFDGVVACDGLGWYIVRWDSEFFAPKIGAPECYHYWFALPPIPKPEKTEAEKANEQCGFSNPEQKQAFMRGYEMGKAAK